MADPATILLLRDALKLTAAVYFAHQKTAGKTDEEIDASFGEVWNEAKTLDPKTLIKDV